MALSSVQHEPMTPGKKPGRHALERRYALIVHQETGARVAGRDRLVHGALGGLAGGVIMAMIMMTVTAAMGLGLLRPLYLIAATVHQPWAMHSGGDLAPLLIGVMIHMMNSAIFGIIFALLLGAVARHSGVGPVSGALVGMAWERSSW